MYEFEQTSNFLFRSKLFLLSFFICYRTSGPGPQLHNIQHLHDILLGQVFRRLQRWFTAGLSLGGETPGFDRIVAVRVRDEIDAGSPKHTAEFYFMNDKGESK
jgi:hypothetical protein